jgi:hypothetical protein
MSAESQTCEVPDEDSLYLQKLELNRVSFERRLNQDLEIEEPTSFKITSNDVAEYRTIDEHCLLATAQWDLIATYRTDSWSWAWSVVPPDPGSRPEIVRNLIQSSDIPKNLTNGDFTFKEDILVSYILARVADILKYTYIHVVPVGDGEFVAFGIKNVRWANYDPVAHKTQLYYGTVGRV